MFLENGPRDVYNIFGDPALLDEACLVKANDHTNLQLWEGSEGICRHLHATILQQDGPKVCNLALTPYLEEG